MREERVGIYSRVLGLHMGLDEVSVLFCSIVLCHFTLCYSHSFLYVTPNVGDMGDMDNQNHYGFLAILKYGIICRT